MAYLDTTGWNLGGVALAAVLVGCGGGDPADPVGDESGTGGDNETEVGEDDGDDTTTPDGDDDDDDCTNYACCGPDCDYNYDDCYSDEDCLEAEVCREGTCEPLDVMPECSTAGLSQIPLPPTGGGTILTFAEVDATPGDELVIESNGTLSIYGDPLVEDGGVETVDLGAEDHVQQLLTEDLDGDGVDEFIVVESGSLARVSVVSLDAERGWEVASVQQLDVRTPLRAANVLDGPEIELVGPTRSLIGLTAISFEGLSVATSQIRETYEVDDFAVLESEDDDHDHLVLSIGGELRVIEDFTDPTELPPIGTAEEQVSVEVGRFTDASVQSVLRLDSLISRTMIGTPNGELVLPASTSSYGSLAGDVDGDGLDELLLQGDDAVFVVHPDAECYDVVSSDPVSFFVDVGDVDGDGDQEPLLVTQSGLAVLDAE